jgi:hypothetical protein
MKKLLYTLLICCFPSLLCAQEIPATDNLLIDKFMQSIVIIEKENLKSDTLQKVFPCALYKVSQWMIVEKDNSFACGSYIVAIKDGKLIELQQPSTNRTLDVLFSLLSKTFSIKNETDARVFETALDKIYPILIPSDNEFKEHFKKANKWYFVRGGFFDNRSGFVLTMDQKFKITSIEFNMEIIK